MKTGDIVECVGSRGYAFTTGNKYTVLSYEAEAAEETFTWPAYVMVRDDAGRRVWCHAHRFKETT